MQKFKKIILSTRKLLCYTIIPFFWPLIFALLGTFLIYRQIISMILRIKFGKKFGGILKASDSIMVTNDGCSYIITNVLIVKSDVQMDIFKFCKEKLQSKVFDFAIFFPKLTSTQHIFAGYPYWINNDYSIEDCLRLIHVSDDEEFGEDYLKKMSGQINSDPFPKNNTALWDIAVIKKPLKNYRNDGFFYYPVVARFSHVIGDGTSLIALLINLVGDENVDNYYKEIIRKVSSLPTEMSIDLHILNKLLNFLKRIITFLVLCIYIALAGLAKGYVATELREDDRNALHGPKLSGEKVASWYAEDHITYFPIVKRIKKRVPDTKFSNIMMTAVSASITNFFKRNSQPIPHMITSVVACLLSFPTIDDAQLVRLENKMTPLIFELPLNQSKSMVELLQGVKTKTKDVRYGDALVNYFCVSKLVGIFPVYISRNLLGSGLETTVVTNIPGGSRVSITNGCSIDKVIPLVPNFKKVGVSISILSYDDRLQVGVLVDKAILSSQEEVQLIANDIFHYIKLLDVETKRTFGDK